MSLPHALLTSLLEKSSSGYELARRFERSIGYFWKATHQQIYRELGRMEAQGWIAANSADEAPQSPEEGLPRLGCRTAGVAGMGGGTLRSCRIARGFNDQVAGRGRHRSARPRARGGAAPRPAPRQARGISGHRSTRLFSSATDARRHVTSSYPEMRHSTGGSPNRLERGSTGHPPSTRIRHGSWGNLIYA